MSLKRPLTHNLARLQRAQQSFSTDGRVTSKIKPLFGSGSFSHTTTCRRTLCTKTEGAIEPSEQAKKDGTVQEAATDK